jgi:hypothetical protein
VRRAATRSAGPFKIDGPAPSRLGRRRSSAEGNEVVQGRGAQVGLGREDVGRGHSVHHRPHHQQYTRGGKDLRHFSACQGAHSLHISAAPLSVTRLQLAATHGIDPDAGTTPRTIARLNTEESL